MFKNDLTCSLKYLNKQKSLSWQRKPSNMSVLKTNDLFNFERRKKLICKKIAPRKKQTKRRDCIHKVHKVNLS